MNASTSQGRTSHPLIRHLRYQSLLAQIFALFYLIVVIVLMIVLVDFIVSSTLSVAAASPQAPQIRADSTLIDWYYNPNETYFITPPSFE